MEKISGIVAASPRTQKVDVSNSQPARPGAPMTGRPEGKNSLGDRISLSKEAEKLKNEKQNLESSAVEKPEAKTYKNTSENNKSKIIDDLNRRFFMNPKEVAREDSQTPKSEEVLNNLESTRSSTRYALAQEESPAPLESLN